MKGTQTNRRVESTQLPAASRLRDPRTRPVTSTTPASEGLVDDRVIVDGVRPARIAPDGVPLDRSVVARTIPDAPIPLSQCQEVMRDLLKLWFESDSREGLYGLSRRQRREFYKERGLKLMLEKRGAVDTDYLRSATIAFEMNSGRRGSVRGSMKLHFPPPEDEITPDTPVLELAFNAPWLDNDPVVVEFNYGWHDPTNHHKGFGFRHNGLIRGRDHTFVNTSAWLNFVVTRVVPLVLESDMLREGGRDGASAYVVEGNSCYGSHDARMMWVVMHREGIDAESGVLTLGWTTAYFPHRARIGLLSKNARRLGIPKAKTINLMDAWRLRDRAIRKVDGRYVVREKSAPLRRALEEGRVVQLWTNRAAGKARVIHVSHEGAEKSIASDDLQEARFSLNLIISLLAGANDELGQFYNDEERAMWIRRFEFFRDRVLPRMSADQLSWFNSYFESSIDYLLKLSGTYSKDAARTVVRQSISMLYRAIFMPDGKSIEGVRTYPVTITPAP